MRSPLLPKLLLYHLSKSTLTSELLELVFSDVPLFVSSDLCQIWQICVKNLKEIFSLQIGPQGQLECFKIILDKEGGVILTSRNKYCFFPSLYGFLVFKTIFLFTTIYFLLFYYSETELPKFSLLILRRVWHLFHFTPN